MEKQFVAFWESDTSEGLEAMIREFIKDGDIRIINVSYSTCYDGERKYVLHSAALAYAIDSTSLDREPTNPSDDSRESYM